MDAAEPQPIKGVADAQPVPVEVVGPTAPASPGIQQQKTDPSVPATTTFQQDLMHAGQRRVNFTWEVTQATIAVLVSMIVSSLCAYIVIEGEASLRAAAFLFLTNIMTAITTTYFVRTNHTKIGGVGPNETGR